MAPMPDRSDPPAPTRATSASDAALPATADVVVIGAGIVGLATARAVQRVDPDLTVVVLDKEDHVAAHQSGHNSGVVHAGVYYRPGSTKSELCRSGRAELLDWCDRHGVPWRRCGKVVVATTTTELARLDELAERATANGIENHRLGPAGLADIEPHAAGRAALHVPATAVIDFAAVCDELADSIRRRGATISLGVRVRDIERHSTRLVVHTSHGSITASTGRQLRRSAQRSVGRVGRGPAGRHHHGLPRRVPRAGPVASAPGARPHLPGA